MMVRKQLKLGVFLMGTGHHIASWRIKQVPADGAEDFDYFKNIASIAEQGKLDMLFLSDSLSFHRYGHPAELARFEPFTLLGALSSVTSRIGLAGTVSTTYNEPFHVARCFSSLDHLSIGRAGWNLVTSYYESEALNFSKEKLLNHDVRYQRAEEFIDVVNGLWKSWEPDALVRDKAAGVYYIPEKLHELNHKGSFFQVRGPLNSSRSPQGKPVVIQSGSSPDGIRLAARTADVVFTAQQTLEESQIFYQKVKSEAVRFGRNPEDVKIMPGMVPYVAETEEKARENFEQLQKLIVPKIGFELLAEYLNGMDLRKYPVDQELPEQIPGTNGNRSRQQLLIDMARRQHLTIRQLMLKVAGTRGHRLIFGNPEQIANQLEEWFVKGAADGFNLMFPFYPEALESFVRLVIPVLQDRGIFRKDYGGTTLREHLGLKVTG